MSAVTPTPPDGDDRADASRRSPWRRRLPLALGALAVLSAVLLVPRLARVPDDEMAPTLLAGDVVLVMPGAAKTGDLVTLVDPLDPSRWTIRRVENLGGQVRVEDGVFYTGNRVDLLEMGRDDAWVTRKEGEHLVRRSVRVPRGETPPVTVADDAVFLGADARDEAMDSRWWGPLPATAIQGRIVARISPPHHPWRGWFDVY